LEVVPQASGVALARATRSQAPQRIAAYRKLASILSSAAAPESRYTRAMTRAMAIIGSFALLLAHLWLHDLAVRAQSPSEGIVLLVDGRVNCIGSDDYVWVDSGNDIFRWNSIARRAEQLKLPALKYAMESRTVEGCIRSGSWANVFYRERGIAPDRPWPARVDTSIWLTERGHQVVSERDAPYPFAYYVMEYPLLEAGVVVASDLTVYRFDTAKWTVIPGLRQSQFLAVGVLRASSSPGAIICFDVDYDTTDNPHPPLQCSILEPDGPRIRVRSGRVSGNGVASARQLRYSGDFQYFAHAVGGSCAAQAKSSSNATAIRVDCRPLDQNFAPLAQYAVPGGFVVLQRTDDGFLCRREYQGLQAELVQERCYQLIDGQGRLASFPPLPAASWLPAFEVGPAIDWRLSILGTATDPKFSCSPSV
jgi:hypothetical protein